MGPTQLATTAALLSASWASWQLVAGLRASAALAGSRAPSAAGKPMTPLDPASEKGQMIDSASAAGEELEEGAVGEDKEDREDNEEPRGHLDLDQNVQDFRSEQSSWSGGEEEEEEEEEEIGWESGEKEERERVRSVKIRARARRTLKMWACLAAVRLFEEYAEFCVAWLPGYAGLKGIGLVYVAVTGAPEMVSAAYASVLIPAFERLESWGRVAESVVLHMLIDAFERLHHSNWTDRLEHMDQNDILKWRKLMMEILPVLENRLNILNKTK